MGRFTSIYKGFPIHMENQNIGRRDESGNGRYKLKVSSHWKIFVYISTWRFRRDMWILFYYWVFRDVLDWGRMETEVSEG